MAIDWLGGVKVDDGGDSALSPGETKINVTIPAMNALTLVRRATYVPEGSETPTNLNPQSFDDKIWPSSTDSMGFSSYKISQSNGELTIKVLPSGSVWSGTVQHQTYSSLGTISINISISYSCTVDKTYTYYENGKGHTITYKPIVEYTVSANSTEKHPGYTVNSCTTDGQFFGGISNTVTYPE